MHVTSFMDNHGRKRARKRIAANETCQPYHLKESERRKDNIKDSFLIALMELTRQENLNRS